MVPAKEIASLTQGLMRYKPHDPYPSPFAPSPCSWRQRRTDRWVFHLTNNIQETEAGAGGGGGQKQIKIPRKLIEIKLSRPAHTHWNLYSAKYINGKSHHPSLGTFMNQDRYLLKYNRTDVIKDAWDSHSRLFATIFITFLDIFKLLAIFYHGINWPYGEAPAGGNTI